MPFLAVLPLCNLRANNAKSLFYDIWIIIPLSRFYKGKNLRTGSSFLLLLLGNVIQIDEHKVEESSVAEQSGLDEDVFIIGAKDGMCVIGFLRVSCGYQCQDVFGFIVEVHFPFVAVAGEPLQVSHTVIAAVAMPETFLGN